MSSEPGQVPSCESLGGSTPLPAQGGLPSIVLGRHASSLGFRHAIGDSSRGHDVAAHRLKAGVYDSWASLRTEKGIPDEQGVEVFDADSDRPVVSPIAPAIVQSR